MCKVQVIKCGTSGFITGLGGLITLPVAIPANVASVIYVQLRMIATVAKIGEKITVNAIKKIPGTVLTKINQKVGFRLITKFGEKGAVNLVKLVPLIGGVVGGGIDIAGTKAIAKVANHIFIEGKIQHLNKFT